jgi:hypothetical protein
MRRAAQAFPGCRGEGTLMYEVIVRGCDKCRLVWRGDCCVVGVDSNALQRSRVPLACAGVALSRVPTCDNQVIATFPQLFAFAISEMFAFGFNFDSTINHHALRNNLAEDALLQHHTTHLQCYQPFCLYLIRRAVQMSRVLDDVLTKYNMD